VADSNSANCFQAMVPMRDGTRLNTFVYLPGDGQATYPVILQRTPYGISEPAGEHPTDPARGWLPSQELPLRGHILRGWKQLTERGYASVYQDCRGRYGSEGIDRVYGDDALDGFDTLEWIDAQRWSDGRVGLSGSSGAATTALAAASQNHPSVRALFAQAGCPNVYNDVVYEGGSIEMERLWLWVAGNIPGLSASHREALLDSSGVTPGEFSQAASLALQRTAELAAAKDDVPPYLKSPAWMHLPLADYPDFSTCQPYLNEMLAHPFPDEFRERHDFRSKINVPGFYVTSWFDIFLNSIIATYEELQSRVGNQRLWIGPNSHEAVYDTDFWPRDPYFEWFDHWLLGAETPLASEPPVYFSPYASTTADAKVASEWVHSGEWPPRDSRVETWHLRGDGCLSGTPDGEPRVYLYDPRHPIPTVGGRTLLIPSGSLDQREVQAMPNYGLTYTSAALPENVTVAGRVAVYLYVESDCADTDFVAKLIDIHPDGQALLIMDGVIRAMCRDGNDIPRHLTPGQAVEVEVDLGHIYHTLAEGHKIQVDITSSNFPRRARNTNSGNALMAWDTDDDLRVARNVVYHGAETPSRLVLPVCAAETREGRNRGSVVG
jgi:putative CocE/NonD family hydrolase